MFRSIYIRPSSGGSWAVLCAVTKLNSVDVRSLRAFNSNTVSWLWLDACHNPVAWHLSTGPCLCNGHFWTTMWSSLLNNRGDTPKHRPAFVGQSEGMKKTWFQPKTSAVLQYIWCSVAKHQLYYSTYDVQWQKIMPIFILKLLYYISRECKLSAFSTWTTSHLLRISVNALPNNAVTSQRIKFHPHLPSNYA